MSEKKRFLLRLDPKIYRALQKWADDEFRSVNAQIEHILSQALRKAGRLKTAPPYGKDDAPGDHDL